MKFKTNLVIAVIFLGLLAFYFYDTRRVEEQKEAAEKAKELLRFTQSEAQKLVIERQDTTIVLEKADGDWALKVPVADAADQDAVERYLRNLQEKSREQVIADSAQVVDDPDVAGQYQLDPPRLKVWLETQTGALDSLAFGGDNPMEDGVYVQQRGENPEIFMVKAWRFDNLDKGIFDLRDRRVLAFDKEEVEEFRLVRPGAQIVVVKEEEDTWQLKEPAGGRADESAVDGLLNRLKNAQIEAFVDEEPDEPALGRYGLAPLVTVEVSLLVGEDRAEKRLRIGAASTEGRHFARDASRPQVFLVDSTLVNALGKEADELRDKKPLRFARDQVTRIELVNSAAERIVAEKDTAGVWAILEPEARKAKSWKLNSLLTDLEQVEVQEFVAEEAGETAAYGLDEPQVLIRLSGEGGEMLEARVGKEEGDKVYLMRGREPQIYLVGGEVRGDLDVKLDDVAQALPKPEPADTAAVDDS